MSMSVIAYDSLSAYLLVFGICALIVSVLILGYLLIPAYRLTVNPESCKTDRNYDCNRNDPVELQKSITRDRIDNCNDLQELLRVTGEQFTIAIVFSAVGLGLIGFALITSIIREFTGISLCLIMGAITAWFIYHYINRAKGKGL